MNSEWAQGRTERGWLQLYGVRPRKRWGQNFLLDVRVVREAEARASWTPGTQVVEVGAGGGAMTGVLLSAGHPVRAVELDPLLAGLLQVRFEREIEQGRCEVVQGDILALPWKDLAPVPVTDRRAWLAGNLPYGLTTPILNQAFRHRDCFEGAVFMVQREYGERLLARPGEDAYGSLSVWTAAHATSRALVRVGRSSFWPRPGVESMVVELVFPDPAPYPGDRRWLERVLRAAFGQRRKQLENALAHGLSLPKEDVRRICEAAGCSPKARAETLSLEQFAALTRLVPGDP